MAKLANVGGQTRIRAHFNTLGLITQQPPQVLRAISSGAAMVIDHLANPISGRGLLEHVLKGPTLLPILIISHEKNHRERCPHPKFYAEPT